MRELQTLEPKEGRGNGKAPICALRIGAELGLQVPDAHMPQAQGRSAGNRTGQGYMACQAILTRTAKEWGVM
jgi:hypothetical protein